MARRFYGGDWEQSERKPFYYDPDVSTRREAAILRDPRSFNPLFMRFQSAESAIMYTRRYVLDHREGFAKSTPDFYVVRGTKGWVAQDKERLRSRTRRAIARIEGTKHKHPGRVHKLGHIPFPVPGDYEDDRAERSFEKKHRRYLKYFSDQTGRVYTIAELQKMGEDE